jgi:hypothetical protein
LGTARHWKVSELADAWLSFHLSSKRLSPYSGARSREVNAGGITMTAGRADLSRHRGYHPAPRGA